MNGHDVVSKIERSGLTVKLNDNDQLVIDGKAPNALSLVEMAKQHQDAVKNYLALRNQILAARMLQWRIDDRGETELLPEYDAALECITAMEHILVCDGHSMDEVAVMVAAAMEEISERAGAAYPS